MRIQAQRVTLSFVGAAANSQKFGIAPDGHVVVGNGDPMDGDPIVPNFAVYFDTADQPFLSPASVFADGENTHRWVVPRKQCLGEGWLPMIETRWSQNDLEFERTDFGSLLDSHQDAQKAIGNEPAVLLSQLKIRNSSPAAGIATYDIRPWKPTDPDRFSFGPLSGEVPEAWTTILRDDLVIASAGGAEVVVCHVDTHQKGTLSLNPSRNAVRYSVHLEPGGEQVIHTAIPGWELLPQAASSLRGLDYQQLETSVSPYWKNRAAQTMRIQIPDAHLQNLFDASLQHFLLGLTKNGTKDEYYPNVAMFYYGSIGSESSPIIRALDMRGLHHLAERCIESFLASQSEFMPDGDYQSKEGGFYRFWPELHRRSGWSSVGDRRSLPLYSRQSMAAARCTENLRGLRFHRSRAKTVDGARCEWRQASPLWPCARRLRRRPS